MHICSRLWDAGVEWGNVQEHVVSLSLLQRALEMPPFLGLGKSGDKELFLVKISTAILKTSQAWSFAD